MAKGRDGIREILESGQAPGFFIRGGGGKNASDPRNFAPEHRTAQSISSAQMGLTPEQYERVQEQGVRDAERLAAETAERRRTGPRKDGEWRHIARVPAAEHHAERMRSGEDYWNDSDEAVKEKLKRRGRLFKHEQ